MTLGLGCQGKGPIDDRDFIDVSRIEVGWLGADGCVTGWQRGPDYVATCYIDGTNLVHGVRPLRDTKRSETRPGA